MQRRKKMVGHFRGSASSSAKHASNRQGAWTIHRVHQVPAQSAAVLDAGYLPTYLPT